MTSDTDAEEAKLVANMDNAQPFNGPNGAQGGQANPDPRGTPENSTVLNAQTQHNLNTAIVIVLRFILDEKKMQDVQEKYVQDGYQCSTMSTAEFLIFMFDRLMNDENADVQQTVGFGDSDIPLVFKQP